ncbi:hypothetical protein N7478_009875 [Penicillium angulare]|uniref:uncharacterized protein n=1 Tax=Penicillium angulare TaxID=116970 RepID=UPI002541C52E|nr:uncharacterized protein N7478_009875 [Penicillium angulare]KAJ5267067.1 hypothetical protein N7478_009875 [Penicillium angulare]
MASNVYSAEPAYPLLAHSLVPQSTTPVIAYEQPIQGSTTSEWNLNDDIATGIKSGSSGIFRCGSVIGFSRLKMRSSDNDEYIGEVPRQILTTHLRKNLLSSEAEAFIIYPSNFDAFAARNLFNDLQSGSSGLSRDDAIKRLDSVHLLHVHDLQNAAQAIKHVSERLQQAQERRQQPHEASISRNSTSVLVVVGLDTLAEGVIRASNPARGAAVLASTLRMMTRMSRTHSDFLSIILVNTSGLGSAYEFDQEGSNRRNNAPSDADVRSSRDDGIHSIFQMPGYPLLSNLLMRTLDQGIDTHILLSDVKYARVAEVIKDRTGPGLGKWGIWSPKR